MEEAKVGQIQEDLTFLQGPELTRFPELSATPGCSRDGERLLPGTFLASSLLLCWVPAWQGSLETSLYPPSTRCETRSFFWPLVLAGLSLLFGPCHRPPAGSVQAWGTGTPRSRSSSLSPRPHPCPLSCCRSGGPVQTPPGQVCVPHHLSVCGGLCPGRQTPLGSRPASHSQTQVPTCSDPTNTGEPDPGGQAPHMRAEIPVSQSNPHRRREPGHAGVQRRCCRPGEPPPESSSSGR